MKVFTRLILWGHDALLFILLLTGFIVVEFYPWMLQLQYLGALCWIYYKRNIHLIQESSFMPCNVLSPWIDLDITADYVEQVAH